LRSASSRSSSSWWSSSSSWPCSAGAAAGSSRPGSPLTPRRRSRGRAPCARRPGPEGSDPAGPKRKGIGQVLSSCRLRRDFARSGEARREAAGLRNVGPPADGFDIASAVLREIFMPLTGSTRRKGLSHLRASTSPRA
jgi:hypothetical protein